jgi:hypothetical protein
MTRSRAWVLPLVSLLPAIVVAWTGAFASTGCGGKDASTTANAAGVDLDGDPVALLPSAPIVLASLDAKAFYASKSAGVELGKLSERLMPIGEESGFLASRDLERVVVGMYSTSGADAVAIVKGSFDEAKIAHAATNSTVTKVGFPIVTSTYTGRALYTVNNIGFVILTAHTAVAGTEGGIRRTLERIQDKRVKRDVPAWMVDTITTQDASIAFAVDLVNQPVANAAIGSLPIHFLNGMRSASVIGGFKDPGMRLAGTLTFGDAAQAQGAAGEIKNAGELARALGAWIPMPIQVKELEVSASDKDVKCKASLDDEGMKRIVTMLPTLIPANPPAR